MVTPDIMLDACNATEQRTRDYIYKTTLRETFIEQPLIDVFAEYENFKIQPKCDMEEEVAEFFHRERIEGTASIVSHEQFLKQFDIFTNGFFEGFDFSNVVVIGGSVIGSLLPLTAIEKDSDKNNEIEIDKIREYYDNVSPFKSSDIDICIYGLDHESFNEKVDYIHNFFQKKLEERGDDREIYNAMSTRQLVFFALYPYRPVQITLSYFIDKWQILTGVDIDCSAYAWDGERLWTTPRGQLAVNYKWTVANSELYKIRGSPQYEMRLVKYADRGFSIIDRFYNDYGLDHTTEDYGRLNNNDYIFSLYNGARLVAAACHSSKVLKAIKEQTTICAGIEYGPKVTYKQIKKKLAMTMDMSDIGYGPDDTCLVLGGYEDTLSVPELPELPYCREYYGTHDYSE